MNGKPEHLPMYNYNWQQAVPAEDFLREWVRRYVELEWIPWPAPGSSSGDILRADRPKDQVHVSGQILLIVCGLELILMQYRVLKSLYQHHGWPTDFNQDEFRAARDAYVEQVRAADRSEEENKHRREL